MNAEKDRTENKRFDTLPVINDIMGYLASDNMRFNQLGEDAVELYMQGNNLTMHLVIYHHNSHLIFRVPNFIRNVELRRLDILMFIMQVTGEILDIRFEISKDGRSLSACCQHILEDGTMTRRQFDLAMMVLVHMVDDTFPQFMKLVYSQAETDAPAVDPVEVKTEPDAEPEDVEENDEFAPVNDDEIVRKLN